MSLPFLLDVYKKECVADNIFREKAVEKISSFIPCFYETCIKS